MRKEIKNSCVLVAGGAGFIGSHLIDRLLDDGANKVVIIDNLYIGKEANIRDAVSRGAVFYKEDASDIECLRRIITENSVDIVFDLITKPLILSFIDPREAFMVNPRICGNFLELQRQKLFETLVHFSSSEVYGTAVYEPMDENHPYNPTTTYAGGKAAADIMLRTYVSMFDLDAFIVRPFNNYGPRQNYELPYCAVIPLTIKRILDGIAPELQGDGKQSRDFIYVLDTVDAVLRLYPLMAPGQEINISATSNIEIGELIQKICDEMGYAGEIKKAPRRGSDVDCHLATNRNLLNLIEFSPRGIDEGLQETIAWFEKEFKK